MGDSNSSDDDLGLFSFPNKKTIVCTPPSSPTAEIQSISNDITPHDRGMFVRMNKRKRFDGPIINNEVGSSLQNENNMSASATSNDEINPIEVLNQKYDDHVANICKIDTVNEPTTPLPLPKKLKKTADKRDKLICDLTGVLNKFKSSQATETTADLPQCSANLPTDSEAPLTRSFLLKLRKGGNLHRFKITMDTPLNTVLQHLAPVYNVTPNHFMLQLNDETLNPIKSPRQIGLTVVDIIEVLVVSEPQTVVVEEEEDNENVIKIKVQSTDHRNNVREYKVMKDKPLVEYLFKACQDFGYGAAKYFFDGEAINPRRTPQQLDLEEHDCLDIVRQT